jgi:D-tyrosyl-tRNA(Tyr) deacylase
MRAVVQRVSNASVTYQVEKEFSGMKRAEELFSGSISQGIIIYLGIGIDDNENDANYLADKITHLRIFMDEQGKMNLSVLEKGFDALVISQFTLLADVRKGRRPSYSQAAEPERAQFLYLFFCEALRKNGVLVQTGKFKEIMHVNYTNEGPVTILVDSKKVF